MTKTWSNSVLFTTIFYLLYSLPTSDLKRYHSIAGPYRVDVKHAINCPLNMMTEEHAVLTIKDERKKITQKDMVYSGTCSMPFYLNNSLSIGLNFATWDRVSGWRENAHVVKIPRACDGVNIYAKKMWRVFRNSILGEQLPCPFYPGFYHLYNLTADYSDLPIKSFFYGQWRADIKFIYKNGQVPGCVRIFLDTVPA